uniref:hypothetical protein n=1 Tax=Pedobacter schmidteae TaxID=2201271 RepID=UPI000EAD60E2|nr:hypothetical protein [Pedobacter schmidteae]
MIKTILPVIAFAFIFSFSACKKIPVLPKKDTDVEIPGPDNPAPTYYINYKVNGVAVSLAEVSATRGTTLTPRTLTILGSGKAGAKPLFKFYSEESYIGFVRGLNIGMSINSAQSHYIEYTNEAGKLFSTDYDNDGIYLFIGEISYVAGGSIKGSFTGTAKTASGDVVNITDGTYNVKFAN